MLKELITRHMSLFFFYVHYKQQFLTISRILLLLLQILFGDFTSMFNFLMLVFTSEAFKKMFFEEFLKLRKLFDAKGKSPSMEMTEVTNSKVTGSSNSTEVHNKPAIF